MCLSVSFPVCVYPSVCSVRSLQNASSILDLCVVDVSSISCLVVTTRIFLLQTFQCSLVGCRKEGGGVGELFLVKT